MTGEQYFMLAYVISVLLLWGYALLMWLEARSLARRERRRASDRSE